MQNRAPTEVVDATAVAVALSGANAGVERSDLECAGVEGARQLLKAGS